MKKVLKLILCACLALALVTSIVAGAFADGEGKATFYLDADTVYETVEFTYGGNISKVSDPEKEGATFGGWFLENGEEYNRLAKYTEDVNVYAKWTQKYTFEAEKTQVTGLDYDSDDNMEYDTINELGKKIGVALSGSANGTDMIVSSAKASGGQYISGIDYKGAYLDFEFTSDKAETGASLSMRLSARFRSLYMSATDTLYRVDILVNGQAVSYDDISIERSDNTQDMGGLDCEDYFKEFFISKIDIQEGENLIRIFINNDCSRTDGTVRAMAPVVDCIYVTSSSELTFKEYEN